MKTETKTESIKIFHFISNFTDIDPNLSDEEHDKILWDLFVEEAKKHNIEVSKDQLLMWLQEDMHRTYVVIEDKNINGVDLFSKSHPETNGLKIVVSKEDINETPLEVIYKVKCHDFKLDK